MRTDPRLAGLNIVVLDLETARSADDCRHCGAAYEEHYADGACQTWEGEKPRESIRQFSGLGWNNKPALGLSIGCYYDYQDGRVHWFDVPTLEATVQDLVGRAPLLVSFNGIGFDFPLMRGLLRREAEEYGFGHGEQTRGEDLRALCDIFKTQCAGSYDILAEICQVDPLAAIWQVDPDGKFVRGLNSLDAIAQANGFGAKLSSGAQAPRDWREGQYAQVLNYCQDDVYKTCQLFERIVYDRGTILRGNGLPITLPVPHFARVQPPGAYFVDVTL